MASLEERGEPFEAKYPWRLYLPDVAPDAFIRRRSPSIRSLASGWRAIAAPANAIAASVAGALGNRGWRPCHLGRQGELKRRAPSVVGARPQATAM
jgi:hypothetical protein